MKKIFTFCIIIIMIFLCAQIAFAEEYYSITPGELWLDNNNGHIQAHGGGVIWDENTNKYYWYGEARKTSIRPSDTGWLWDSNQRIGVACYSSTDLYNWTYEGLALRVINYYTSEYPLSDIQPYKVIERPKVIYNDKTGKYVMWMHIDSSDYSYARAGVAVSDSPTGPFTYLGSYRPNGKMARDMTVFKDDDGTAYLYASGDENMTMYCHKLTDDYLEIEGTYTKMFENWQREAPAVFKYNGKYFMINSGCSGWDPNKADSAVATNPMGPWTSKGNPCTGENKDKTFGGQSTHVLEVDRENGKYIFMADIWRPSDHSDSRYIWLPIEFTGSDTFKIAWQDEWRVDTWATKTKIEQAGNIVLTKGDVYKKIIDSDKELSVESVNGDNVAVSVKGNEMTIYALQTGTAEISIRAGGGGYAGNTTTFSVTVNSQGARAYRENNGKVMINAKDALLNTEYAYAKTPYVQYWAETETGLEVLPDIGDDWFDTENRWQAPSLNYRIEILNPGDYYVYLNCSHENISGNSLYVGIDGEYIFTSTGEDNLGENVWLNNEEWKINFPQSGVYTINIWGREDGSKINSICLSNTYLDDFDIAASNLRFAKEAPYELTGEEKIEADLFLNEKIKRVLYEDIPFESFYGTSMNISGSSFVKETGEVLRPGRGEGEKRDIITVTYEADGVERTEEIKVTIPEICDEYISTDNFNTVDIGSIKDHGFVSFYLTAEEISDGMIAFCGKNTTPSDWSHYPIAVRIQPDGTMDARNGSAYEKTEVFNYETGKEYLVLMDIDVKGQKYSVWVFDENEEYCIADNFSFRIAADNIGRVTIRGGNYVQEGLFEVRDIVASETGIRMLDLNPWESTVDGKILFYDECDLYAAFYSTDGELMNFKSIALNEKGVQSFEFDAPSGYKKVRIIARNEDYITPVCESMAREIFLPDTILSSAQDEAAFTYISAKDEKAIYSFTFTDNGSVDSGIMLGDSTYLNPSSGNYFASGSIVLLFAGGTLYTRDDKGKEEVCTYTVGEKTEIKIIADIESDTYDLYVDQTLVKEGINFRIDAEYIDTLALVENKGGEMFNVNNFTAK